MADAASNHILPIGEAAAQALLADEELQAHCKRFGIDLGLLVENLKCTSEMRLKRHSNALRMALTFRQAGQNSLTTHG